MRVAIMGRLRNVRSRSTRKLTNLAVAGALLSSGITSQQLIGDLTKPPLTPAHSPAYLRQVLEPSFQQSFAIVQALGIICEAAWCVPFDVPEPAFSNNVWLADQLISLWASDVGGRIYVCYLKIAATGFTAPDSRVDNPGGGATEVLTSDPSNLIAINGRWLNPSGAVGGQYMGPTGLSGSFEAAASLAGTIFHESLHAQENGTKTQPDPTPAELCEHYKNHEEIHNRTKQFYEMIRDNQECLGVTGKDEHLQKLMDSAEANANRFKDLAAKAGCQ